MRILEELLDLAFPATCAVCRRAPGAARRMCDGCERAIRPGLDSGSSPCPTCVDPDASDAHAREGCPACRAATPDTPLRYAGDYEGPLRDLILAAKWQRRPEAVEIVSELALAAALRRSWADDVDAWCPVPRDRWRWLRHGVPLSEYVGRYLGRHLGIPRVPPPGRRRRAPQVELTRQQRITNLAGAFSTSRRHGRRLAGRRVLLVDDVMTTGSTIRECARSLRAAGAAEVRTIVIAVRP